MDDILRTKVARWLALCVMLLLPCAAAAQARLAPGGVCPTTSQNYVDGTVYYLLVDSTGRLCTNAGAAAPVSGTVTSNDGGTAITGATMPAGGSGLTGWLSAIWSRLGGTLTTAFAAQTGAINQVQVNCNTAATMLLAAGAAAHFVRVSEPSAGSIPVWFNWAGAPAVAAPPSEDIAPGGKVVWIASTGYLPNSQFSCIATAATPVTVEYE